MIHRGEILEKAIRNSHIPISKIAVQLKCNRKSLYDFFTYANADLDMMIRVGKIINYDFSNDIPELSNNEMLDLKIGSHLLASKATTTEEKLQKIQASIEYTVFLLSELKKHLAGVE